MCYSVTCLDGLKKTLKVYFRSFFNEIACENGRKKTCESIRIFKNREEFKMVGPLFYSFIFSLFNVVVINSDYMTSDIRKLREQDIAMSGR